MKVPAIRALGGVLVKFFSGFVGAGLVFALSPILLLLTGSSPEADAYTNVELGFSLLTLAGTSGCLFGVISNVYRLVEVPLPISSQFIRLSAHPEFIPGRSLGERERILPGVAPSLVLPTLISGLGGWVEVAVRAPRITVRSFAA